MEVISLLKLGENFLEQMFESDIKVTDYNSLLLRTLRTDVDKRKEGTPNGIPSLLYKSIFSISDEPMSWQETWLSFFPAKHWQERQFSSPTMIGWSFPFASWIKEPCGQKV